jgi:hypothetical protein
VKDFNWDEVGFPAEPTSVRQDLTRVGPRVMRRDDRDAGLEAQRKYTEANRDKERARSREAMRALYKRRKGTL